MNIEIVFKADSDIFNNKAEAGMYYMVNTKGEITQAPKNGRFAHRRKNFGNYFKTYSQAEKALKGIQRVFKKII